MSRYNLLPCVLLTWCYVGYEHSLFPLRDCVGNEQANGRGNHLRRPSRFKAAGDFALARLFVFLDYP